MGLQHSGRNSGTDQYDFGKTPVEKQREISREKSDNNDAPAINEKLPQKNSAEKEKEQSQERH